MKFESVDGTIPPIPNNFDPTFHSWNRCNMLVHSWIMNSVLDIVFMYHIIFEQNGIPRIWHYHLFVIPSQKQYYLFYCFVPSINLL